MSTIYVAVLAAVVAMAGYFTLLIDVAEPAWPVVGTSEPPADGGAGNTLMPLADDLTWIYRTRGLWKMHRMQVSIVGREEVGGEEGWILEEWVGLPDARRYTLVNRDGDIWVVKGEQLDNLGIWKSMDLLGPQLWQPAPDGVRVWTYRLTARQGEPVRSMARAGTRKVLGSRRPLWQVETTYGEVIGPFVATIAEGVGPIEFDSPVFVASGPQRLTEFRSTRPELHGPFEARVHKDGHPAPGPIWAIELERDGAGRIDGPDGGGTLAWVKGDDGSLRLDSEINGRSFRWVGVHNGAGLLGQATFSGRSFALEFVVL